MLDFVERVVEAQSIEDLWSWHCEAMARFGFSRLFYGLTRFRTARSLGDPDDFLILTNLGEDYIRHYVDDGLYADAPMVQWALENTGPCSWQWYADQLDTLSPKAREVIAFNHAHGIKAGYTIGFRDVSVRSKGGIALIADEDVAQSEVDARWQEIGRQVTAMNNIAHLRILGLPYQHQRRSLTPRQREALEWVGEGKTTQDIATIMGLTPATIEKHLRLAREALDVETTAQAVLKASFQNQIFVVAP